jgi:hypothetical protein
LRDCRLRLERGNKYIFTDDQCKHYFTICLLVKNRDKHRIEHLNGYSKCSAESQSEAQAEPKDTHNMNKEDYYKGFDRQARGFQERAILRRSCVIVDPRIHITTQLNPLIDLHPGGGVQRRVAEVASHAHS